MAERSDVSVGDALLFAQAQRIRELEARVASAEEVIRPFARASNEMRPEFTGKPYEPTLADFRRAASWSKREDKC